MSNRPNGGRHRRPARRWLVRATVLHAASVAAALGAIRWAGERYWLTAMLPYVPRWLFLLPMPALLAVAIRLGWGRAVAAQLLIASAILGPLMCGSLPLGRPRRPPPDGPSLRIMTFNRGTEGIDAARLIDLIERERIAIICLQEGGGDPTMRAYWERAGWHRADFIASRFPIVSAGGSRRTDDDPFPQWRTRLEFARLRVDSGREVVAASIHLDTARHGLDMLRAGDLGGWRRHTAWRRREAERAASELAAFDAPALIGGDFNLPPDSPMLAPFRRRFRSAFGEAGRGFGYTYPSRLPWVRIDHVFASRHWAIGRCWVGPDLGSDHRPLIAEVTLDRAAD